MAKPMSVPNLVYSLTFVGIYANLHLMVFPPESGNGITTLPLVIFLLSALGASCLPTTGVAAEKLAHFRTGLIKNRRHLGICAGLWALTHGITKTALSLDIQQSQLTTEFQRPEIISALLALLILSSLLITSNDTSQRLLGKRWKQLHQLAWLVPGLALVHGYTASVNFTIEKQMNAPVLIPLLILIALPIITLLKNRTEKSVKQITLVLCGALSALILILILGPSPTADILQD